MAKLKGRLFVALPLTEEARRRLVGHLERTVPGGRLPGRVVAPGNWHFTLRFLGDTQVEEYDALRVGLEKLDLGSPFDLTFTGLGAFPKPNRARVMWIGTGRGARELGDIAALVEDAVVVAGFEPERRQFRSHLTVSRLRPEQDVQSFVDVVPAADVRMPVREIAVIRSHLGPEGARYEVLDRLPLKSG
jgi:2'-5' RNA ligase